MKTFDCAAYTSMAQLSCHTRVPVRILCKLVNLGEDVEGLDNL